CYFVGRRHRNRGGGDGTGLAGGCGAAGGDEGRRTRRGERSRGKRVGVGCVFPVSRRHRGGGRRRRYGSGPARRAGERRRRDRGGGRTRYCDGTHRPARVQTRLIDRRNPVSAGFESRITTNKCTPHPFSGSYTSTPRTR